VNWTVITSIAAVAAVFVALLQWMTAQTKIALDIHVARYAIYQDLRDAVTLYARELRYTNEVATKYIDAQSRARFLPAPGRHRPDVSLKLNAKRNCDWSSTAKNP
jgi:hypothetical protein